MKRTPCDWIGPLCGWVIAALLLFDLANNMFFHQHWFDYLHLGTWHDCTISPAGDLGCEEGEMHLQFRWHEMPPREQKP